MFGASKPKRTTQKPSGSVRMTFSKYKEGKIIQMEVFSQSDEELAAHQL